MSFLELCQEVRDRTGITRFGLPSTVIGQVGQLAYLVDNVARADMFIQRMHTDWKFLFTEHSFGALTAGTATISSPSTVWNWDLESFYINKGTADATNLKYLPYKEFRSTFYSTASPNDTPSFFAIKPGGDIIVNPPPSSGKVLTADYYKKPVKMTVDASVSDIDEYNQAIVELAVFYYAEKRHDGGLMQSSWSKFKNELLLLEDNELPERYETNSQHPDITITVE